MEKPVIKMFTKKWILVSSLFLLMAVILLSYFNKLVSSDPKIVIRLEPNNLNMVSLGELVYKENCAGCHGLTLKGQKNWKERDADGYMPAPPHDETGHTWHHSDQYLFYITKYGIEKFLELDYPNNMPIYEHVLTDTEILASLSYIKSKWPEHIQRMHDEMNSN